MSVKALEPGNHYLPSKSAWERYQNQGGQAEYRARGVQSQHDQVAELVGIPGYGWRILDLIPCVPSLPTVTVQPDVILNVPKEARVSYTEPHCVIEVELHRFESRVDAGNLFIDFEDEEDGDCAGEECEACNGDGCKVTPDPISAEELLEHLLSDYDNCPRSYADYKEIDASNVDQLLRDLLLLVKNIKTKI